MPGYANPFQAPPGTTGIDEDFFLNSDPDAAFYKYLQAMGLNTQNPGGNYARAQQGKVYNQYKAQAAADPNQGFYDYLRSARPDLAGEFNNQSPEQRGDYSSRILTPRARWVST